MSAEEELQAFKLQTLKRARVTAIVLGCAAVISVLFMVYGFTQNIEATKQKDIALYQERQLQECQKRAEAAHQASIMEMERAKGLLEKMESLTKAKK